MEFVIETSIGGQMIPGWLGELLIIIGVFSCGWWLRALLDKALVKELTERYDSQINEMRDYLNRMESP